MNPFEAHIRELFSKTSSKEYSLQRALLENKRRKQIRRMCRLTLRELGSPGRFLVDQHIEEFWPNGKNGIFDDCIAFLERVQRYPELSQMVRQQELNWLRFLGSDSKQMRHVYLQPQGHWNFLCFQWLNRSRSGEVHSHFFAIPLIPNEFILALKGCRVYLRDRFLEQ